MKDCAGRNRKMLPALSAPISVRLAFGTGYLLALATLVTSWYAIPAYLLKPLDAGFIIRKLPKELRNANGLGYVLLRC